MLVFYKDTDKLRIISKTEGPSRSPYRRDNGRLVHSASFRRLQGKTQLFPTYESDFFRNRLTHSLEVAQIAKGIAEQINHTYFSGENGDRRINLDIVETAALAHDLGHPPFGHNGEKALDKKMRDCGGFEGNAQTLRILAKLEKKETCDSTTTGRFKQTTPEGEDNRCGLNFTFRTLASILKYDKIIPKQRKEHEELVKGYYYTENDLVNNIKAHVLNDKTKTAEFMTIECQIMELADDISYCTYDLEDALKSGFISPLGILTSDKHILERVAKKVRKHCEIDSFDWKDVSISLNRILGMDKGVAKVKKLWENGKKGSVEQLVKFSANSMSVISEKLSTNGYHRTAHTAELIHKLMSSVTFEPNSDEPTLSKVALDSTNRVDVEVLKHFNYEAVISSSRLRISEYRGQEIVSVIFDAIADQFSELPDSFDIFDGDLTSLPDWERRKELKGECLLPEDSRKLYRDFKSPADKKRVICDFIAGMTDRYAIEFYGRLKSEHPQTIFKPL